MGRSARGEEEARDGPERRRESGMGQQDWGVGLGF